MAATRPQRPKAFDLSSVDTPASRHRLRGSKDKGSLSSIHPRDNVFKLKSAKTYFPSIAEFNDPITYIDSIRAEAEQYGIIKIVAPPSWNPSFSLDTKNFRFKTRLQQLNVLDGNNRAKKNYSEKVLAFHEKVFNKHMKIPILDKKTIDLHNLKTQVCQRGGVEAVIKNKLWAEVGRSLGYDNKSCTSLSNSLKVTFLNFIKPYEDYLSTDSNEFGIHKPGESSNPESTVPSNLPPEKNQLVKDDDIESSSDDEDFWTNYGFEDSPNLYSLSEFQNKSDLFKKSMFQSFFQNSSPYTTNPVPLDVVEKRFWSLVKNQDEDFVVEYGADLASSIYGSGFPTPELDPLDPYTSSGWNLTNIPKSKNSLFPFLKEEVDGMTIPWLYVGMCMSAFCWHNEDHYTYSINYMHWGEPKTWYGVPGSQSDLFESTVKKHLPELFESNPNILFHLVTMVSPQIFKDNGVDVFTIDQYPVNFATPDWIPFGLSSIKYYQRHKRHPVFCHEELIYNINQKYLDSGGTRPDWLLLSMHDLVLTEIHLREDILNFFSYNQKSLPMKQVMLDEFIRTNTETSFNSDSSSSYCVNCSECFKLCFFSFIYIRNQNFGSFVCLQCFKKKYHSDTSKYKTNEISLVFRSSNTDLQSKSFQTSENSTKWINSVWKIIYPYASDTFSTSSTSHSMKSILNTINVSPNINKFDYNPIVVPTNYSSIILAEIRSLVNYSTYLLGTEDTPMFIQEYHLQLLEFVKKSNLLCFISQCLLKQFGKLDKLKDCLKSTIDLAYKVKDPLVLINDIKQETQSTNDPSQKEIPSSHSEVFKELSILIDPKKDISIDNLQGSALPPLPHLKTTNTALKNEHSKKSAANFGSPNKDDDFTTRSHITSSGSRSSRPKRSTAQYKNPSFSYAAYITSPFLDESTPSESHSLEPEDVYDFCSRKSKQETLTAIEYIFSKLKINIRSKSQTKDISLAHIDKLLKEFSKLKVDCPEANAIKAWYSQNIQLQRAAQGFINSMAHFNLINRECSVCASDKSICEYLYFDITSFENSSLSQCNELIKWLDDSNIFYPEYSILADLVPKLEWVVSLKNEFAARSLDMNKLVYYLEEAIKLKIPPNQYEFTRLRSERASVINWEEEVAEILGISVRKNAKSKILTLRKSATLMERANNFQFFPRYYEDLKEVNNMILKLQSSCDLLVEQASNDYFPSRPTLEEAQKLYSTLKDFDKKNTFEFSPNTKPELEQFILDSEKWLFEVKSAFTRPNATRSISNILISVHQTTQRSLNIVSQIANSIIPSDGMKEKRLEKLDFDLNNILYFVDEDNDFRAGQVSNTRAKLKPLREILCVCQSTDTGSKIKCLTCPIVFHTKCLKLSKDSNNEYTQSPCPVCLQNSLFTYSTKNPSLTSVNLLIEKGRRLNLVCPELDLLLNIALDVRSISSTINKCIEPLEKLSGDRTKNMKYKHLHDSICRAILLITTGLEVNIANENVGSISSIGTYFDITFRKKLFNMSLNNPQISEGFLAERKRRTRYNPKQTLPKTTSNSEMERSSLLLLGQHKKRKASGEKISVYSSDSQEEVPLEARLFKEEASLRGFDSSTKSFKSKPSSSAKRFTEKESKAHLLSTSSIEKLNHEICVCRATPKTDPNWHRYNNFIIQCDFCREYFHINCVLVPEDQAAEILYFQNLRKNYKTAEPLNISMSSFHKGMAFMCPICSYTKNIPYEYGEIILDD
ncbi:hypothetical protein BB560_003626 [Smittium megazygosporum]|uniref:[histone H3]-trimethyl-L-lysine(4) demethylase n=1 Tax=Smittium megazygosporum TaxID=133381 RepID=A0A2T9ZBF6_9FUNG|nr:hypothetical protein BB560_003626 [Smittium megazygosporum]